MRFLGAFLLLILGAAVAADIPLIQPKELAGQISEKSAPATILYVGPNALYRSKHIPAAIYAGPGSKPEGLDELRQAVAKLPHDARIVLYCGCCPWDRCPNIRPAVELLRQMGFTQVKALSLPTGFAKDWIDEGYPVESQAAH